MNNIFFTLKNIMTHVFCTCASIENRNCVKEFGNYFKNDEKIMKIKNL